MITKSSSFGGLNNLNLECYSGQKWRGVCKSFGGAQKIMCGSQTLEQEAVKLKLPWRPQDVRGARVTGCLPRKAANREWKQLKGRNCAAVNKDERS